MGVTAVIQRDEGTDIRLEWISETQWLRRNGDAITNLNLLVHAGASEARLSSCPDYRLRLAVLLPYRVSHIRDTSRDWLQEANVMYYSNSSGTYFRIVDADRRLVTDRNGVFVVNEHHSRARCTPLPRGRFIKERYATWIDLDFQYPLDGSNRHMVQVEYVAERVAFRRSWIRPLFGANWYLLNRYYSIYDIWDPEKRCIALPDAPAEGSLVPVELVENWIALPGFARAEDFAPEPELRSMVTIDHPGYRASLLGITAQVVARFRVETSREDSPWFSHQFFCEYQSQPVPTWMVQAAFWLTVLGLILALLSR